MSNAPFRADDRGSRARAAPSTDRRRGAALCDTGRLGDVAGVRGERSLPDRPRRPRRRTHGNDSVATARGIAWVTHDRCDGTLTRVTEGAVIVRDLARGRRVRLEAGESYLARGRR
jgi:hypothetical protein